MPTGETISQANPETPSAALAPDASETITVPAFPNDPNQYTEAELQADPAKRFHVNPADFPIFSQQGEKRTYFGPAEPQNLNYTLGRYVRDTADLISIISGEAEKSPGAYDHIVYLDKSARPVSWLVNTFWQDFTDTERPPHSYLAIDRGDWFQNVGLDADADGYLTAERRKATFSDFKAQADLVPPEVFARIRALYIPGGIETEDPATIMDTPTPLDGQHILVVDEVSRTGATKEIAKYLLERAFPDATVDAHEFWDHTSVIHPSTGDSEMASVPVWYDASSEYGRGIGDKDPEYFEAKYQENPNPRTRARRFGAKVLGRPINLATEPGQRSRGLAAEIKKLHAEYQAGHILPPLPRFGHYDQEKWVDRLQKQGIIFTAAKPQPKNAYTKISSDQAHSKT